MADLKLIGWTNFECKYPSRNIDNETLNEVVQLIGDDFIMNGYCFSGQDHQTSLTGVPVFSDGTCLRASMRAWGQIMAAIFSAVEEKDYSYMDFYMDTPNETVLPEESEIEIEPAYMEEERPGMILNEDVELIRSAIEMNMELMTLDKVIKRYVELLKNN